ncbi:conserved hypothetical protein [Halolactibacillus halophilus]|uniref:Purine nucleoside phosphorylase n=1 Tax=Halolactibacillus halophilus TaxID=306540 RepID=A0A1I5LQT6_9BACI|nr:peptidoglycan editing factor PgeF [Halolactibacillus halophilus]GEM00698.1 laccase domain protein YlmD [Halolactibacillus halophilus]SFO99709.1 conserved hypothetical protein [Halolactibacillus halophilus]
MDLFKRQSKRRLHAEKVTHQHHINLGMSTRIGGVSKGNYTSLNTGLHVGDCDADVIENRTRVLNEMNQSLDRAVFAEQVHGHKVKIIESSDAGRGAYRLSNHIPGVDGLITTSSDIVLAQFYADCVPLYFFDPIHHIVGIAHAGWRGTAKGIAKTMLDAFLSVGADLNHIHVVIGPAIAQANYQVNGDVVKQMPVPVDKDIVVQVSEDQYLLDVKAVNAKYLRLLGVNNDQIMTSLLDTYSHPDLYSYRKEQQTGRMMGYIFQ